MRQMLLGALMLLLPIVSALAFSPDVPLADAREEARAHALFRNFRCMTCQSQAIDESDAGLAKDLRMLIREKIRTGQSDDAIKDFVVTRYGEFVLFAPPMNERTLALWGMPFLILCVGGLMVFVMAKKRG
jgi:cytochrome c-type biogenesis protein CcmH